MNYGSVVSRAWSIFWKQKVIWLFYIVALLPIFVYSIATILIDPTGLSNSSETLQIITTLIIYAISTVLTTFGLVGIIRGVARCYKDPLLVLTFRDIYDDVLPRFGKTLLFNFIYYAVSLVFFGIVTIGGTGLASTGAQESMALMLSSLCQCILAPVLIVAGYVYTLMMIALVVDDLSIGEAIRRGWNVFFQNVGQFLVIGLIVVGIGLGFSIVAMIPVFCTMGAYLNELVASGVTDPALMSIHLPWYVTVSVFVLSLLGLLFGIFINSIYVTAYLEITKRPGWKKEQLPEELEQEPL